MLSENYGVVVIENVVKHEILRNNMFREVETSNPIRRYIGNPQDNPQ